MKYSGCDDPAYQYTAFFYALECHGHVVPCEPSANLGPEFHVIAFIIYDFEYYADRPAPSVSLTVHTRDETITRDYSLALIAEKKCVLGRLRRTHYKPRSAFTNPLEREWRDLLDSISFGAAHTANATRNNVAARFLLQKEHFERCDQKWRSQLPRWRGTSAWPELDWHYDEWQLALAALFASPDTFIDTINQLDDAVKNNDPENLPEIYPFLMLREDILRQYERLDPNMPEAALLAEMTKKPEDVATIPGLDADSQPATKH